MPYLSVKKRKKKWRGYSRIMLDAGLHLAIANDSSVFTLQSADAVIHDLLLAVVLVAFVMLFFLHSIRNSLDCNGFDTGFAHRYFYRHQAVWIFAQPDDIAGAIACGWVYWWMMPSWYWRTFTATWKWVKTAFALLTMRRKKLVLPFLPLPS